MDSTNYLWSTCVQAGRCVKAMYGVPPCEDLGPSVLLGFGDKLASLCIAPALAAALCKGLVGHQEREPIPPTIERVK